MGDAWGSRADWELLLPAGDVEERDDWTKSEYRPATLREPGWAGPAKEPELAKTDLDVTAEPGKEPKVAVAALPE